ncbi:hypothetical protein PHSC3_000239 [Chlamydiales bacterium STE3]|nr:hypothetical protein PHSC3_000239 [Chlamydiales bacterium STE3]
MEFHRAKIIKCEPHDNYKLWILFDDGIEGEVDLKNLVGKGVFSSWNSIDYFKSVYIDKKTDTVAWGEDLDLDPYVLRDQIILNKKQKNFS